MNINDIDFGTTVKINGKLYMAMDPVSDGYLKALKLDDNHVDYIAVDDVTIEDPEQSVDPMDVISSVISDVKSGKM